MIWSGVVVVVGFDFDGSVGLHLLSILVYIVNLTLE
jgi:hypothetical protein